VNRIEEILEKKGLTQIHRQKIGQKLTS